MGVRHKILCDATLNAGGIEFSVDSAGRLSPEPAPDLAAKLVMLANYEHADPAPKPAAKKTTTRRRKPAPAPKAED